MLNKMDAIYEINLKAREENLNFSLSLHKGLKITVASIPTFP